MSSYLRSVVTWDERQTHQGCVRRVSNSSRTYISIYMAIIWGQWRRLSGGKGEGPLVEVLQRSPQQSPPNR